MIVTNPYTESCVEIPEVTDLASIYQRANSSAVEWRSRSVVQRVIALGLAYDECSGASDQLASCISDEMGKPITKSRVEMERALEEWRYMLDNAPQFLEPEPLSGGATLHFRPLGVVANVSPWNFPVLLPLRAIVPALLSGNSVIFKPSELTPRVALEFSRLISKYAPLEVAIGGKELGAQVVDLPVSAQSVAAQLVCGAVRINAHGALGPGIPWSGCKESGIGQAKTREGLREFTHI
jgi:acyl-CoA reductase-like NAD-dependent aldehyde dehydrogenase